MMKGCRLYPEEQMHIERKALDVFLFAADFGDGGIDHLMKSLEQLKERLESCPDKEESFEIALSDESK